jgi:hypothetical protein
VHGVASGQDTNRIDLYGILRPVKAIDQVAGAWRGNGQRGSRSSGTPCRLDRARWLKAADGIEFAAIIIPPFAIANITASYNHDDGSILRSPEKVQQQQ